MRELEQRDAIVELYGRKTNEDLRIRTAVLKIRSSVECDTVESECDNGLHQSATLGFLDMRILSVR